jgi:transposase
MVKGLWTCAHVNQKPEETMRTSKLTDEQVADAIRRHDKGNGEELKAIAKELGVKYHTLYSRIRTFKGVKATKETSAPQPAASKSSAPRSRLDGNIEAIVETVVRRVLLRVVERLLK